MKLLVISDTHLKQLKPGLPEILLREISNCDLLIHAGDFDSGRVYRELRSMTEICAVRGNMDESISCESIPISLIKEIDGFKIGVIHGSGSPRQNLTRVRSSFEKVDLIVFGHSHQPFNEMLGGVRLFNPGSPTSPRGQHPPSYGVIEISDQGLTAEVVFIER